jgi:hypothetical protein
MTTTLVTPEPCLVARFTNQLPYAVIRPKDRITQPVRFSNCLERLMPKHLAACFAPLGQIPPLLLTFNLSAGGNGETLSAMRARGVRRGERLLARVTEFRRGVPITVRAYAPPAMLTRLLVPLGLTSILTTFADARGLIPVYANSHGGAAVFAGLLIPLSITSRFTAFTNLWWIIPIMVSLDRCSAVRAIDFVPFSGTSIFTRLANTWRIAPVFMHVDFRVAILT